MKKRIAALLLCLITLFSLVSCDDGLPDGAELPEGMQYAGGETEGFFMYVPEEWTLSSLEGVVGAYVSSLDHSSVSLARVEKPAEVSIADYFAGVMADMPYADYTLVKNGVARSVGNVTKGTAYEYTYSYKPYEKDAIAYRTMQLFAEFGGRLYCFTYTAQDTKKTEDKTYFTLHLEDVNAVIDALKFIDPMEKQSATVTYEADGDGYLQISKKRTAGFAFYMHPDWECTMSSGTVELQGKGGASINLAEARDTGVAVDEYFKKRKSDLERYTDGPVTSVKEGETVPFGNADKAIAYEYTYTYRGTQYHTYQVMIVHEKIPLLLQKGYVFTFTAPETVYAAELASVMKMIGKVTF